MKGYDHTGVPSIPTAAAGGAQTLIVTQVGDTPVGDINSSARGSGARANAGKVPVELLPLRVIAANWGEPINFADSTKRLALEALDAIGRWQEGDNRALFTALLVSCKATSAMFGKGLTPACHVFDYGRRKYKEWNWAKGMPWSVVLGCAARHLFAILDGEEADSESKLSHWGHFQCNVIMGLTYINTFPEGNDLPGAVLSGVKP